MNASEENSRTAFIEIRIAPPMLVGEECLGTEIIFARELMRLEEDAKNTERNVVLSCVPFSAAA
jgi:hypothetical protein